MYKCEDCNREFKKKYHLRRHIENVHLKQFQCKSCNAKFKTEDELSLHKEAKHPNNQKRRQKQMGRFLRKR